MKNHIKYSSILLLIALISVINIKCESIIAIIFNGIVEGNVNSGSGNLALGDATVTQSSGNGEPNPLRINQTVVSKPDGSYRFNNISTGINKFIYSKGLFSDTIILDIQDNQLYENVNSYLRLDPDIKLAFLAGDRDNIQQIVTQLGYPIEQIEVSDFKSLQTLLKYRYIFINSGNNSRYNLNTPDVSANISSYLDQGGLIYASDWAVECLKPIFDLPGTYNGINQTIPNAAIVETDLLRFMEKDIVQISYNQNDWYSLDSTIDCNVYIHYIKANYSVIVNGNILQVTDRPIAVYSDIGSNGGKFIFNTFCNSTTTSADAIKILQFYVFQE